MLNKNKNKITILVKKVNIEEYKELKSKNVYPLIIETNFLDIFDAKGYYKEGNLYKLKIEFLKEQFWHRTCQNKGFNIDKDVLDFDDSTCFDIFSYLLENESPSKEEGLVLSTESGQEFITMEDLYNKALGIQKEVQEDDKEKVRIYKEVADFRSYDIMRKNGILPLVIVLTEYENRIVSYPFDDLYIKTPINHDGKIVLSLEMRNLKGMIAEGKIELNGIKLEDGKVYKLDEMLGGDYGSLGLFSVGEQKEDIMALTKKLLEPKKFKSNN